MQDLGITAENDLPEALAGWFRDAVSGDWAAGDRLLEYLPLARDDPEPSLTWIRPDCRGVKRISPRV